MKNRSVKVIRWVLLAAILVWVTVIAYLHQSMGGGLAPSIHAICPFGGLESLYSFFKSGTFISKIFSGTLILFAITLVLALLFRRSFCGLICPFGALQEFFHKLGRKILKKRFEILKHIDKPLRFLKYIILIITVVFAWTTAGLWVAPYDPWSAYAHLSEGLANVWAESAFGVIILIITIIGSILYDRFFCKYLCPMGALYGIIGKISPYKVVRDQNACIDCNLCNKNCPVNIDVAHSKEVTTAECISCQSCVLSCPKEGALVLKQGKKKINPIISIVLVLILFFVPIFVSRAYGVFNVLPSKYSANQTIKIEEVKGYMTIKDVAEYTKVDIKEVYEKLKIPENVPKDTKMKDIKTIEPEYDFDSVKESLND